MKIFHQNWKSEIMTGYLTTNLQKIKYSGKSASLEGCPLPPPHSVDILTAREWVILPFSSLPDQKILTWMGRWNGFALSPASETNSMIRFSQVSGELVQVLVNSNELQF